MGLLVRERLHHENLWAAWAENADVTGVIHASSSTYTGSIWADHVTPTVPSSWAQTIGAHYQLMRAFLPTGSSHLMLASESCIPITPAKEAIQALCRPGYTTMGIRGVWWKPADPWRKTPRVLWPYLMGHEQWMCLSRPHVELLLQHEIAIRAWMAECNADNETYAGTALRYFGQMDKIHNLKATHVTWPGRSKHPVVHQGVTPALLQAARASGSHFMRKIDPTANIENIMQQVTPKRGRPRKQNTEPSKPKVLIAVVLTAGYYDQLPILEKQIPGLIIADAKGDYLTVNPETTHWPIKPQQFTGNWNQILTSIVNAKTNTYVWCLSDDVVLPDGAFETAQRLINEHDAVVFSPVFNSHHKVTQPHPGEDVREVPYVEYTAPIVSLEWWKANAPYPAELVHGWGVDLWAGWKTRTGGATTLALDGLTMDHLGGRTNHTAIGQAEYHTRAAREMVDFLKREIGPDWAKQITDGTPYRLPEWMYTAK